MAAGVRPMRLRPRGAAPRRGAFVGGGHLLPAGVGQVVGGRVDAGHRDHLQAVGQPQHLDHQIGADVAGPDDRHLRPGVHLAAHSFAPSAANPTLRLPKISSALVGGGARSVREVDRRSRPSGRSREAGAYRGKMIDRVAATGLLGRDECVRHAAPATDGRWRQDCRDTRLAPPDHGAETPTRQGAGAVHPERPGLSGGAAAPAPHGRAPRSAAGGAFRTRCCAGTATFSPAAMLPSPGPGARDGLGPCTPCGPWCCAWHGTIPAGDIGACTVNCSSWA